MLIDSFDFHLDELLEQDAGPYEFAGKFAQADIPTSNKRIYSRNLWERELKKLERKIQEGKVYGELDHPSDGRTKLQRAAVLITGLNIDEQGQIIGRLKILDTSMGKELKAIVDGGGAIGISSRGYGSVRMNEDGYNVVQDDFNLMTFDPVADPAEESAYLNTEKPMKTHSEENETNGDVQEKDDMQSDAQQNASPMKNEPSLPDENTKDTKDAATDDVHDAPSGNVENEKEDEKEEEVDDKEDEFQMKDQMKSAKIEKEEEKKEEEKEVDNKEKMKSISQNDKDDSSKDDETEKKVLEDKTLSEVTTQAISDALKKQKSDFENVLEQKDRELLATKLKLEQMTEAAKQMGFNLYLERHLSSLSEARIKDVIASVGDYKKIDSLDELKKKVAPVVKESKKIKEIEENKMLSLQEKLDERTEQVETLREELEDAIQIGLENAARVYLERKITGNPYQGQLREDFEKLETKTKGAVDKLVSESRVKRKNESSDFNRIRDRIKNMNGNRFQSSQEDLVEKNVKDTFPNRKQNRLEVIEGHSFDMAEISRLAGVQLGS